MHFRSKDALSTFLPTKSAVAYTSTTACLKTTIPTTRATTISNVTAPLLCQSISNLIETNVLPSNTAKNSNDNKTKQQETQEAQKQQQQQNQQSQTHANDPSMHPLERFDAGSVTLESEYSAMVASVYEQEIANSDCASVASDLTRMYVSDEDEKHDYRLTDLH